MADKNPYEGYDPIDPWEHDSVDAFGNRISDETGSFEFVEDEYDSVDAAGDGFGLAENAPDPVTPGSSASDTLEHTVVRRNFGNVVSDRGSVSDTQEFPGGAAAYARSVAPATKRGAQPAPARMDDAPRGRSKPPRRERRPRRRHRFGWVVKLLVIVAIVCGAYWVVAHPIDEKLAFSSSEEATVGNSLSLHIPCVPYYVLALGSDAREGDTVSRTDTMVLVRVDFIGGKLTLISIPRDTKVELEGYGTQKINAAYAFGGVGGAVRAVSELTGVPISHAAVVHFDELANLVDYLGGVTVNVPVDVYDPDHTGLVLSSGLQTMDGETAVLWARTRYGFELGDYQRQEDQRILLTAIMNRMLSLSPKEIPGALECMGDLIGTDMRCYNIVPLFLRLKLSSPTVYSCTVPSSTAEIDGVSYVIADESGLSAMMQRVNAGQDPNVG